MSVILISANFYYSIYSLFCLMYRSAFCYFHNKRLCVYMCFKTWAGYLHIVCWYDSAIIPAWCPLPWLLFQKLTKNSCGGELGASPPQLFGRGGDCPSGVAAYDVCIWVFQTNVFTTLTDSCWNDYARSAEILPLSEPETLRQVNHSLVHLY